MPRRRCRAVSPSTAAPRRRSAGGRCSGGAVGDEPRRLGREREARLPATERGNGRNGPRTTVRSVASSSSALCTTPMPLCTSVSGGRERRPRWRRAVRKPKPGPGVDRDGAVPQLRQRLVESGSEPPAGVRGVDEDVDAERAGEDGRSRAATAARRKPAPVPGTSVTAEHRCEVLRGQMPFRRPSACDLRPAAGRRPATRACG